MDTRLPLVLTIVAFASFVPLSGFKGNAFAACLLALLGLRSVTTAVHYNDWDEKQEGVLADLRQVPAGSILLVTRHKDSHAFDAVAWNPPLMHLGCLLLLERPLLSQDLFTIRTQQPLLKNAPYDKLDLTAKVGGIRARDLQDYGREAAAETLKFGLQNTPEYVFYVKAKGPEKLPPELTPIVVRERYAIYKVNPMALRSDSHFTLPSSEVKDQQIAGEIDRWNTSN